MRAGVTNIAVFFFRLVALWGFDVAGGGKKKEEKKSAVTRGN